MSHARQGFDSRERARSGADYQQVALTKGRCCHVSDHVSVQPEVHEAHAERPHHQALAPDPVASDPVGSQHLVAEPVDLCSRTVLEDPADLVERPGEETVRVHFATPARRDFRLAAASPPSNTALPATITSTPMAAMEPTFSRVTPPSTPSITLRPLRSIRSLTAARRRCVFGANRCPPQPGSTARTNTSSTSSSSGSTTSTGVPGLSAMPRLTAEPSAWRTRCGCRVASTWKVSMSAPAST